MKRDFDRDFKDLLDNYAGLPSAGDHSPLCLAEFCNHIKEGVEAIEAISRSIGNQDIDPNAQSMAIGIITVKLCFELKAMQMMLLKRAGHY